MSDNNKEIAQAVGHIPSGLFIVVGHDQNENRTDGFLASWISQVSFSPLLVSLCIKPGRPAYDKIKSGEPFTINVVGEHDKNYMKHFWSGFDKEKNVFAEIDHTKHDNGTVSINGAKSFITCKLKESFSPGDHEIVIAEVIASHVNEDSAKPMVHIRKSGLDY